MSRGSPEKPNQQGIYFREPVVELKIWNLQGRLELRQDL